MLTHSEAQALISARLDAPLDDDIERILEDHLAGCDECRLFAASSNRLASALDALPTVPPSPAVRQAVWAAIERKPTVWSRLGGALSGQTAAVVSTAAIALLVIAFAALVIVRLTGSDDGGDDERTQLAAGTQEGIALATEPAAPTETPAQPTEAVRSTEGEAPTAEGGATDELVPTDASQSLPPTETTVATEAAPEVTPTLSSNTAPPSGPTEEPADLTGETSVAEEESTDTPVNLTGDDAALAESAEPTAGNEVVAAVLDATAESTATPLPTETPVPPTDTPEPTETPEPTATPEPVPANLTVRVLDQEGEPVGNACFALIDGDDTVSESCDTPEWETAEFAGNGNTGFFDVPPGSYTLRMTQQPDDVTGVEDQAVEIAPGSDETVIVSVSVATPTAAPTETPAPTNTPEPTATQSPPTETPIPTSTPEPTLAPAPTDPPQPSPTSTPDPAESEQPTSPPIVPI
ncbi:MAG TPA: zf-HC2 domain-containing protein, partial [Thermomicrobiales bacterium]|nr:zf-HC2 domain-containing protein [Thermomicrobiales bacterium]